MKNKIKEMLTLQDKINSLAAGEQWKTGISNKNKVINWKTCIFTEGAELVESTPWKHWKNIGAEPDWSNIQIEIVDEWHFILSEFLLKHYSNLDKLSSIIEEEMTKGLINKELDFEALNLNTKKLIFEALVCDLEDKEFEVSKIFPPFIEMMNYSGLTFEELYLSYIFKNSLNIFRQNNGYKEGTYIKIWNGREDNEYLMDLKNVNSKITFDEIYSNLTKLYGDLN